MFGKTGGTANFSLCDEFTDMRDDKQCDARGSSSYNDILSNKRQYSVLMESTLDTHNRKWCLHRGDQNCWRNLVRLAKRRSKEWLETSPKITAPLPQAPSSNLPSDEIFPSEVDGRKLELYNDYSNTARLHVGCNRSVTIGVRKSIVL